MAILYVRSTDGSNADNGSTWALAKATLAGALSAATAGDTIYVSQVHAESSSSGITLVSPGTVVSPIKIVCANDGAQPPTAVATTGTLTTTSGTDLDLQGGSAYIYGLSFISDALLYVRGNVAGNWWLDTCKLTLGTTGSRQILLGLGEFTHSHRILRNCTFKFGHTNQGLAPCIGPTFIVGGSVDAGGTIPTNLVLGSSSWQALIQFNGTDLSAMGSNTLVANAGSTSNPRLLMQNCKLGSSAVITASQTNDHNIDLIDCDSGATNYRHERYQYAGSQVIETTIVRTGGATDGTTPISWKIVTSADAAWVHPFESLPMAIWNDTTAANRTVTVYGVWGGGAVPNNDEIWIEVSYHGSSGSPLATINTANTKADILASASAQGSDSSTWGGSTTKFKMAVTLSSPQPQLKGPIYVTVKAAKASSTFYIDPKVVLS